MTDLSLGLIAFERNSPLVKCPFEKNLFSLSCVCRANLYVCMLHVRFSMTVRSDLSIIFPGGLTVPARTSYVTTTDGQLLAVSMGVSPLAGYSGGCVQKYHYPSLMVIAFHGSQSHGRGLTPNFSVRACRPVACSLLRQWERICCWVFGFQ